MLVDLRNWKKTNVEINWVKWKSDKIVRRQKICKSNTWLLEKRELASLSFMLQSVITCINKARSITVMFLISLLLIINIHTMKILFLASFIGLSTAVLPEILMSFGEHGVTCNAQLLVLAFYTCHFWNGCSRKQWQWPFIIIPSLLI